MGLDDEVPVAQVPDILLAQDLVFKAFAIDDDQATLGGKSGDVLRSAMPPHVDAVGHAVEFGELP